MKNNKRIKVFLGGYVNSINAQNLNCAAIARYIDKTKFEPGVLTIYSGSLPTTDIDAKIFKVRFPHKLWRYWSYLRGILWCDVAYLPKGEIDGFCRFVAKIFGKKVFTTVEGILDDILKSRVGETEFAGYIEHFRKYEPNLYSITNYIKVVESKDKGYHFADKILYLGVDSSAFTASNMAQTAKSLTNIIFIGNDLIRKNIGDFLDAARAMPDIQFHIVGGDTIREGNIEEYIKKNDFMNVTYHGRLDHPRLSKLLAEMDLMFFPSRSEGFPKVHLETACAGVPTLCYNDYGADEWITSWNNGIVVSTKEEAMEAIKRLANEPETLQSISENAIMLGQRFDWDNVIKDWETIIEQLIEKE